MNRTLLIFSAVATFGGAFLAAPAMAQVAPPTNGTPAPAGDYSLTFSGGAYNGSATLTADSSGHVTGISGSVNDGGTLYTIVGVDSTYASADNNLYITPAYVTFAGISFDLMGALGDPLNGAALNLFNDLTVNGGNGEYGLLDSVSNPGGYNTINDTPVFVDVSGVPEPATWALMLLGFGGIGAIMRRKNTASHLPQIA